MYILKIAYQFCHVQLKIELCNAQLLEMFDRGLQTKKNQAGQNLSFSV